MPIGATSDMAIGRQLLPVFKEKLSVLYVERAVIERDLHSVAAFTDDGKTQAPIAGVALLMLGPGANLTHAAMSQLVKEDCLVAWVGEEGVRTYAYGFGGPRSSANLVRQAKLATDPEQRTAVARKMYEKRFKQPISPEHSIDQIRGMEGARVRAAYRKLADQYGIEWEGRDYDQADWHDASPVNRALSAANACLYGVCCAAILALGYSPGLGFVHTGNQLSLAYDMADLYKLDLSVPVAFEQAAQGEHLLERRVRHAMRDAFKESRFLQKIVADLDELLGEQEE